MIHLTIGLFKHEHEAGSAISILRESKFSKDISVIAKDDKTGEIRLHQVKESPGVEEKAGSIAGAEIGVLAGIISGVSAIMNPALATLGIVGALAASMGVAGAAVGATIGGFFGSLNDAGLPPERAKIYKESVHKGELLVCVSSRLEDRDKIAEMLNKNNAYNVHMLEAKN